MPKDVSRSGNSENQQSDQTSTRRYSSSNTGYIRDFATYKHQFHEQQHRDPEAKHTENTNPRLSQLRSQHHRFKGQLTAKELRALDDQAQALWQANDRAAKRDVATDRGLRNAPNCAISLGHRPDRYMARGGVIIDIGKDDKLMDYLQTDELKAFTSATRMEKSGTNKSDLPPREREAFRLYSAISKMHQSSRDYTVEHVQGKLGQMRRMQRYKDAFSDTQKPANQEGSSRSQGEGSSSHHDLSFLKPLDLSQPYYNEEDQEAWHNTVNQPWR